MSARQVTAAVRGSPRMPVAHNHLTLDRRPKGECPLCDLWWEVQQAQVARLRHRARDEWKPEAPTCNAPVDADHDLTHTCDLPQRHRGHHHCPRCRITWSAVA